MIKLVFSGEIEQGQVQTEVVQRLATLLKQSPEQIQARLFTGKPVVIKQVENTTEATKWLSAFKRAGAVLAAVDPKPASVPVTPPAKEPAATQPEATQDKQENVQDDQPSAATPNEDSQAVTDNNATSMSSRKYWWMGLGVVAVVLVLLAFWFSQSMLQAKPLTQADNAVLNALVSDELYGVGHVNVESLQKLSSLSDSHFDLDSIPGVNAGFWQSLEQQNIDVREQFTHVWVGAFHNGEKANLVWVMTGQFDSVAIQAWLTERYTIEEETEAGLLFSWLHETTCEKVSPLLAVVENQHVIIGDPEQVAIFQARLAANSQSAIDLTSWREHSEKQLASLAVFTPKNLGATFSGMEGMMLRGIGKMASPASGLYVGLTPTLLPAGVELSAQVVSSDKAFVSDTYEKINTGLANAKAASMTQWPELTALYERISFTQEKQGVRGAIRIDSAIKTQLGDLFSSFISSAFSVPKNALSQGEAPTEKIDENAPVFFDTQNTVFTGYVDEYGENATAVGPFGLMVQKLSVDEDEGLLLELMVKAKGLENLSPTLDVTSIQIQDVIDKNNNSLLPTPACGPDKSRESTELDTTTNNQYIDGKSIVSLMVSGTKKIQLPPATRISDIAGINGVITYKQPQKLQRVILKAPLVGQTLEQYGLKLRFLQSDNGQLNYEARGNTDALLYVYARNVKGEPLYSQGASWSDDKRSAKKTVNRNFQGAIASVELVLVEKFKTFEYDFSLDSTAPSIGAITHYFPQPRVLTDAEWKNVSTQVAPVVTEFGWSKPKTTQTVGSALMALTDIRFDKNFGFGLSADFYIPYEPKLVGVLGAGTLMVNTLTLADGETENVDFQTSFPFAFDGGYYMNGVYQPDENRPWLKATANIKERDFKVLGATKVAGVVALSAAEAVKESRILANLGEKFENENFTLTFSEWGRNALKFTASGDLSSLVAIKALDLEGNVVSQPAKLSSFFGETEVTLEVGAMPAEFVLIQATESRTVQHPFVLDLSVINN